MEVVSVMKYQRKMALLKWFICLFFVLAGCGFILLIATTDMSLARWLMFLTASLVSFIYFGTLMAMLTYYLFRWNTVFLHYTESQFWTKSVKINWKDVEKVRFEEKLITSGFVFDLKDNQTFFVQTNVLLSQMEIKQYETVFRHFAQIS